MIFIDTGAWIARFLALDQHYRQAMATWRRMKESQDTVATSNLVIAEALTFLGRKAQSSLPATAARDLYGSDTLSILRPTLEDDLQALVLFEKYADQRVSFTDAVSFALMRRHGIKRVFTFDRHFRLAGFEVIP